MNRAELAARPDCLTVLRQPIAPVHPAPGQPGTFSSYTPPMPECFLAVLDDDRIVGFNGHVDLGTGIRTSLAQVVAEELDVAPSAVQMLLGDTQVTPNQGPTIASATLQISAVPLRCAAAQARAALLQLAATRWQVAVEQLDTRDGEIFFRDDDATAILADGAALARRDDRRVRFGALLKGQRLALTLDLKTVVKDPSQWRIVGRSAARVDIPAKATGALTFVHDVRVPGMLHGRVVRPPYGGIDHGDFVGHLLESVDERSIAHIRGIRKVVVIGDFIGIVAEREEQAIAAAKQLQVRWKPLPSLPSMDDPAAAIKRAPAQARLLLEEGDVDAARRVDGAQTVSRSYAWPYQMHGSIGPSCAVAEYRDAGAGKITIWSGTQNPVSLRYDLSLLMQRDEADIDIVRLEASGCYGRNCADDVCGDALLLARAVGVPVRVQLSRADEHTWEPKGTGQVVDVDATIDAVGTLIAYDFRTRYPSNDGPLLASLLTGRIEPKGKVFEMGDRTAVSPYRSTNRRFYCDDLAPLVRSSWLRGVSALPNSFAHDSMIDELAFLAEEDPLAFRLRHLDDSRAVELLEAVAQRAQWQRAPARGAAHWAARSAHGARLLHGRGVAYARYVHSRFPGFGAAWSAWIVDLTVDCVTGEITVQRLTVGQDTGTMINPDGVRHQLHGNVVQVLSRTLKESVRFVDGKVSAREWGAYPILGFAELPTIDVVLMPRQGEPPMGAGESASVPGPAAIANAIFDATGIRMTAPPFTPEAVRRALAAHGRLLTEGDTTPMVAAV